MAEVLAPAKVPTLITIRFDESDREVIADLMKLTGLTEGTQLVRLSVRVARDTMRDMQSPRGRSKRSSTPIEPR